MECSLCCENINKSTRKEVKCIRCNYIMCLMCYRRYLLEYVGEPECPNPDCKFPYTIEFIRSVTPKVFYGHEYQNKLIDDLLSRERSLLPATQAAAERIRKQKEYRKKTKEIKKELDDNKQEKEYISSRIEEIHKEKNSSKTNKTILLDEQGYLIFRQVELYKEMKTKSDILADMKSKMKQYNDNTIIKSDERKQFIMKCPDENCNGFLSQAYKCGTCDKYFCSKCHTVKKDREDKNHICDTETVETIKLLKQDTKPCPGCSVPITKISGCDQMWCTSCHVAFSWNTCKIEKSIIHNPHFYEFQRQQNNGIAPRVPGDVPCYENLDFPDIIVENLLTTQNQTFKFFKNCVLLVRNIRGRILPNYADRIGAHDNLDLRIKYLINELDDKSWKRCLKLRQKKLEKNREIHLIFRMFITTVVDTMHNFILNNTVLLEDQIKRIRIYVNQQLHEIFLRYDKTVTPCITINYFLEYLDKRCSSTFEEKTYILPY